MNQYYKIGIAIMMCLSLHRIAQSQSGAMEQFMQQRFGLFIHFGPVTLRGTEIGWSRGHEVAQSDYDSLYREFDPVLFNADEWVRTAKAAGMKYLTITAKHHDGFCLWPTTVSSYNISRSPFKRDIVGELAQACRRQGIIFCVYFTVLDWHDPDYPTKDPWDSTKNVKGDMTRFVRTMEQELKEIISRYHPFMLWFDGYWEKCWTLEDGKAIYRYIRSLDPHLIVNNRLGKSFASLSEPQAVGDFLTPEQTIGQLNMNDPWESCITLCTQWAWKPNDRMKTLKECLQTLERTAGCNGNLLFNIGPMMDGRIEARQAQRLKEMGNWLKQYGESIYGTKGGPWPPDDQFASTRKGNKIYLHIFNAQTTSLTLPAPGQLHVKKAGYLHGAEVQFTTADGQLTLGLGPNASSSAEPVSRVVVLELDGNTELLPVIPLIKH